MCKSTHNFRYNQEKGEIFIFLFQIIKKSAKKFANQKKMCNFAAVPLQKTEK